MLSVKWGLTMVLVTTLAVSQAQADGVLAPGRPAGVRKASRSPNILMMGLAGAVAVAGIAIAVAQSNDAVCGSACDASTVTTTT